MFALITSIVSLVIACVGAWAGWSAARAAKRQAEVAEQTLQLALLDESVPRELREKLLDPETKQILEDIAERRWARAAEFFAQLATVSLGGAPIPSGGPGRVSEAPGDVDAGPERD